ncbi:MAG: Stk1 family PASTA domain-containing Ser/Thr kinase [Bifidobacteriaceae bacterium]|nr:Stk1 family PASTA domain-containing Ser/Thr kinase [Bifidobacteriaceae bacterium]
MSNAALKSLANGRYELGQLIGRGGMAEVYVATDTRLGRTVAIKIMRPDLAKDEIFLSRFRREAHSIAQMNATNIVNIFDSGEETITSENGTTEHVPYLVMEYVKGQTLRDIIKTNGALNQRDAAQVLIGVLNALEYSHRMGVIHRDIKPGNIMISEQGVVKVMDFGIARALDDSNATMTQSQDVVGTAQYLSPEQARGETVDMRSDLYSAGCVLYEMLTGRPPFTGDSTVAIAYQHVSEVATPPSVIVPGLSHSWDQVCAKAMAKDCQSRYATAADFKNDVITCINGGVPTAAAFNPITDLSNMKARNEANQLARTQTLTSPETAATQAFNPLTGQIQQVSPDSNALSRTQQREAVKAKKRKKIIIASIIAVLVAIAAIVGIVFALRPNDSTVMVTVPTFNSTTTEDAATDKLTELGLKVKIEEDHNSSKPKGTFTKQDPDGGTKVAKGTTVTVWFSSGPASGTVPDVKGKSQADARKILENAGFTVSSTTSTENSATVAKDLVTRTDPAAGESITRDKSITLYISSGMTEAPDGLVGKSQADALKALQDAGFKPVVVMENSSDQASGNVTRVVLSDGSTLQAGSTFPQNTAVTVYVSSGKTQVTVPSGLVGKQFSYVKSLLEAAGFSVQPTNESALDSDIVTATNPSSGSKADAGSSIQVTTRSASSSNSGSSNSNSSSSSNN